MSAALARHWRVLRESWALETDRARTRRAAAEPRFLPAALEVTETPPNPLGRWLLWTMIAFVGVAVVWSCWAKVDVIAVANGKIIAADRNKLVQAADGGVVRAIHVRDGQSVKAGDILVELDPTTAGADRAQAESALAAARIDQARLHAILNGLAGKPAVFVAPPGASPDLKPTQELLIRSRISEEDAKEETLRHQALEGQAQIASTAADLARLESTLPYLKERVEKRRELVDQGYMPRLRQLEQEQEQVDHEGQIRVQQENLNRNRESVAGVRQQLAMARSQAVRETLADLAKAETEIRQRDQELRKANMRNGLQAIRAPAAGVVQQLAVYTEGAVLKPADPVLVIVPREAQLVVDAKVLNRDIGFVREGQLVSVKLEAFPFTRYGTVKGRLIQISRDAIQEEKVGPIYQARIGLSKSYIDADGQRTPLSPGLTATAEIRTGSRRVIDFLLSPLERRVMEAGRER